MILDRTADPHPDTMCHYTTLAGLHGIIRSGSIWLTDVVGLNDPSEFRAAIPAITTHIKAKLNEGGRERFKKFVESEGLDLEDESQKLANIVVDATLKTCPAFIASFCDHEAPYDEENGRLSQWVAYGRFMIRFKQARLESCFNRVRSEHRIMLGFGHVSYYDGRVFSEPFNQRAEEVASGLIDLVLDKKDGADEKTFNSAINLFPILKMFEYRHEEEYRLIAHCQPMLDGSFSIKRTCYNNEDSVRQRIEPFLPGEVLPAISGILIGPQPNQSDLERQIKSLLELHSLDVPVACSEIAFRG